MSGPRASRFNAQTRRGLHSQSSAARNAAPMLSLTGRLCSASGKAGADPTYCYTLRFLLNPRIFSSSHSFVMPSDFHADNQRSSILASTD